jgi:hypothetical protein
VFLDELAVDAIRNDTAFSSVLFVDFSVPLCETPLARRNDQLTARELELGTAESLESVINMLNKKF